MKEKSTIFADFDALLDDECRAFFDSESISFDLSLAWFMNLTKTSFKPQDKLLIGVAENESGEAVVLPMYCDDGELGARTIHSLVNFYTSLYAPIKTHGADYDLLSHALFRIVQSCPGWDVINFRPLAREGQDFDALFKALREIGAMPFGYFCFGNWYLPVAERSYAQYFSTLPSRLRNTLKRKSKQFNLSGGRLEIIREADKIEAGIEGYLKVYNSSWKIPEPYPEFIPGLIEFCQKRDWIRLGIAYIQDEPVAAQLWIVCHGRAAIYKLAYDEAFASYSAGSILTAHLMQYVMDIDKVGEVDYLVGDDAYKKDWMSHRRERWGIVAYNPKTLKGLAFSVRQKVVEARKVLSSLLLGFKNRYKKPE